VLNLDGDYDQVVNNKTVWQWIKKNSQHHKKSFRVEQIGNMPLNWNIKAIFDTESCSCTIMSSRLFCL